MGDKRTDQDLSEGDDRHGAGSSSKHGSTEGKGPWKARLIMLIVALATLALMWFFAVTIVPRWWAQRLGNAVDGRYTFGSFVGITMGVVFTLLPILVLWLGWRLRSTWKRAAMFVAAAVIVGLPNLATLGIVLGNGNGAHDGERILSVDGPGIRGGTAIGAVIGAVLGLGFVFLTWSRRRNKAKAKELSQRDSTD